MPQTEIKEAKYPAEFVSAAGNPAVVATPTREQRKFKLDCELQDYLYAVILNREAEPGYTHFKKEYAEIGAEGHLQTEIQQFLQILDEKLKTLIFCYHNPDPKIAAELIELEALYKKFGEHAQMRFPKLFEHPLEFYGRVKAIIEKTPEKLFANLEAKEHAARIDAVEQLLNLPFIAGKEPPPSRPVFIYHKNINVLRLTREHYRTAAKLLLAEYEKSPAPNYAKILRVQVQLLMAYEQISFAELQAMLHNVFENLANLLDKLELPNYLKDFKKNREAFGKILKQPPQNDEERIKLKKAREFCEHLAYVLGGIHKYFPYFNLELYDRFYLLTPALFIPNFNFHQRRPHIIFICCRFLQHYAKSLLKNNEFKDARNIYEIIVRTLSSLYQHSPNDDYKNALIEIRQELADLYVQQAKDNASEEKPEELQAKAITQYIEILSLILNDKKINWPLLCQILIKLSALASAKVAPDIWSQNVLIKAFDKLTEVPDILFDTRLKIILLKLSAENLLQHGRIDLAFKVFLPVISNTHVTQLKPSPDPLAQEWKTDVAALEPSLDHLIAQAWKAVQPTLDDRLKSQFRDHFDRKDKVYTRREDLESKKDIDGLVRLYCTGAIKTTQNNILILQAIIKLQFSAGYISPGNPRRFFLFVMELERLYPSLGVHSVKDQIPKMSQKTRIFHFFEKNELYDYWSPFLLNDGYFENEDRDKPRVQADLAYAWQELNLHQFSRGNPELFKDIFTTVQAMLPKPAIAHGAELAPLPTTSLARQVWQAGEVSGGETKDEKRKEQDVQLQSAAAPTQSKRLVPGGGGA